MGLWKELRWTEMLGSEEHQGKDMSGISAEDMGKARRMERLGWQASHGGVLEGWNRA